MSTGNIDKPKILLLDIETLPDFSEILKIWPSVSDYPGRTLKATVSSVICIGYKWLHEHKRARCLNAWDYPGWGKNKNNDKKLLQEFYEIAKKADAIVTHNGRRFDWPFIQTRLLYHGLPPLNEAPHIDTCHIAKKNLKSYNNRLGYLGQWLAGDDKLANGGWELWVKVYNDVASAKTLMTRYCKQDVDLLHKVYERLRPFITNLPNYNMYRLKDGVEQVCSNCGSQNLIGWGYHRTKTTEYRRYRCKDCHSTGRVNVRGHQMRAIK